MRNAEEQFSRGKALYPVIQPYDYDFLDVGDVHTLYVEQCGNPKGIPVVVLHGGPGAGVRPACGASFIPIFIA